MMSWTWLMDIQKPCGTIVMKDVPPKHDLTEPRAWFSLFHGHGGWASLVAAVICIAKRRGLGKIRHLDVEDLWIQDKV